MFIHFYILSLIQRKSSELGKEVSKCGLFLLILRPLGAANHLAK